MKLLAEVRREDVSTDVEIRAMQDGTPTFKVVILKDGTIYCHLADADEDTLAGIVKAVRRVCKDVFVVDVNPVVLDAYLEENARGRKHKTSSVVVDGNTTNIKLEYVFGQATKVNASDVYLIIGNGKTELQFKVFGLKYVFDTFDQEAGYQLARLIYTTAGSQYEKTAPCDCSFSFPSNDNLYRIRSNSVQTANGGHAIACRIRNPKEIHPIEELGFSPLQLEHMYQIFHAPGGLIPFVGATNSGKSTTVSSVVQAIPLSNHIIEIADPIEIEIAHCVQIEINRFHKDFQVIFAAILASIVRQNPDVLVLGEIRDTLTAMAAVNMAIQGKRVYSTLHTTNVPGVFPRLNGLGVPNHLLALPDFIAGVISQTLVAKACPDCALSYDQVKLTDYEESQLKGLKTQDMKFRNDKTNCEKCSRGISGQELLAEVHPFYIDSGAIYDIIKKQDYFKILRHMQDKHGVILKSQHAREKIMEGLVDPRSVIQLLGNIRVPNE